MDRRDLYARMLERRIRDIEASTLAAGVGATGPAGITPPGFDGSWDEVEYYEVATASNVATVMAEWPVNPNQMQAIFATIVGAELSGTIDVYGAGRHCVFRRTGTGATAVTGVASMWADTSGGMLSDFQAGTTTARLRVTGNVGVPARWKCCVRRYLLP